MTRPLVNWHSRTTRDRTTGQRAADILRNGMGSWPFVFSFLGLMVVWATLQFGTLAWDPYPFILLNLILSALAGLQGAILLIAAKRQDAISASLAQHDYETNVAAAREIDELLMINRRQLELIERLVADRDGGNGRGLPA
ncbi:uncharacterized protein DUF1003 [Microcella alkaliphila]|uniref:Uncharacterized protein DUF1003 n=1 Tax=Microcella alkaliphila TaxID=279828 RepID=A0A4Q7TDN1_9MICO|nr:DUF1003 domain-containing protein [Microcella alkaliphila]RZT58475.1 uncharacterized protein DUF1003 [Microcella alkaliphila]